MAEIKEVKVRLYDWQVRALHERGLAVSEVVRDLVSLYLRGDIDDTIRQLSALNRLHEIRDKLNELAKEYAEILEEFPEITPVGQPPVSIRAHDERVIQAILEAFSDVDRNPKKLESKVYDVNEAVAIRLYTWVPTRLGMKVSPTYINHLIMTDERLAFLRPYILPHKDA